MRNRWLVSGSVKFYRNFFLERGGGWEGGEVAGIHGGGGEREGRHEIQLRSVGM